MIDKINIFNIPANYNFFESLIFWSEKQLGKNFSEAKFFLPNRRSCRYFREILAKNKNSKLPKFKAISDISYEDFFDFLPNSEAQSAIAELLALKPLDDIDYLLFITKKIQQNREFGTNIDFNQAFKIALNLKNIFEEIDREEIDLEKIFIIDDSNLSKHRIASLEFLKNFYIEIKNLLLKEKIFSQNVHTNLIITKFSQFLEKYDYKSPIIIAGSTGSIGFSLKLIKSAAKKHYIVLHGLNDDSYQEENHSQFFLNRLVKTLEITKKSITNIEEEKFFLSAKARQNLLSVTMAPASDCNKWQEIEKHLEINLVAEDLKNNFCLIEAENEIEEARLIKAALDDAIKHQKNAALITNNQQLADLVKLELTKSGILFNDSRGVEITKSKLINFIILILDLIEKDFDSHILLTLLKNPLCFYSQNQKMINDFEINILRQDRIETGLKGILQKLETDFHLQEFFAEFYLSLQNFTKNKSPKTIAEITNFLILICEKLTHKTWQVLITKEPAQVEIFTIFEKFKSQTTFVDTANISETFRLIFKQIKFFAKSSSFAPIQILSTIEARLLNYDLVIFASLNQGQFPENISEDWLGKKIKKDLGIDKNLKKIGQNAHDFINHLSNKSVILTRSKTNNGNAINESPFLLKLKIICQKIGVKIDDGQKFFAAISKKNQIRKFIRNANPKPDLSLRPKKFSITEINKLLSNPYEIYAKKILKLEELKKIDYEPNYAEFGSFIHKALEEFVKNPSENDFLKKAEKIFAEYFLYKESFITWWPKFENIFHNFILQNQQFLGLENIVEMNAELKINDITLRGKIDRVLVNTDKSAEIFDYKTGQVPSKNEVLSGANPQLTIAALMLKQYTISSLAYWKLSTSQENEIKKISNNKDEIAELIIAAQQGLTKLFAFFHNEKNGYLATDIFTHNPYQHLARTIK